MGIYHFATVGLHPGAVTTGLSFLKHQFEEDTKKLKAQLKGEEPGDEYEPGRDFIEALVLFTTDEVYQGRVTPEKAKWNDYGTTKHKPPERNPNVLAIIKEFVETELKSVATAKKDKFVGCKEILYCPLDDLWSYESCFEIAAKAVLHFSPPGETGKNIHVNLTGGTNVMNAALMQVASLSGMISRLYYTFVDDSLGPEYLRPPSRDRNRFRFEYIPMMKTAADPLYFELIETLGLLKNWCTDEDLLSQMKQTAENQFKLSKENVDRLKRIDLQTLQQEYLNKLDGRELERESQTSNRLQLSERGQFLLAKLQSPLYRALIERGLGESEGEVTLTEQIKAAVSDQKRIRIWPEP